MGPLEIGAIVVATAGYLIVRGFTGPKLSDGRGRERREEPVAEVVVPASVPETKATLT